MKVHDKDLQVGNGIEPNGFLEDGVLYMRKYPELWGADGKVVEKAHHPLLHTYEMTHEVGSFCQVPE